MGESAASQPDPPVRILLGFARALRAAGLPVTADRERTFVRAVAEVGLEHRSGVYWAGRTTLSTSPADIERYDQVFHAWFSCTPMMQVPRHGPTPPRAPQASLDEPDAAGPGSERGDELRAMASAVEILRHRDVATLTPSERAALNRRFAQLAPRPPRRTSRRWQAASSGVVDGRATLRETLARLGEPGPVRLRRKATRKRRVVLLIDVSGSMSGYADSLLRLAHRVVQASLPARTVEVFTMGTRLTHVTRALYLRDADQALVAAGNAVADWSGGTRLGEALAVFLARWGRRSLARGAVVVVFSDGWERDGPQVLGESMRALAMLAHRVVWVNPHAGKHGYAPVQSGIVAALPYVDALVAGHSMSAFEHVLELIAKR